MLIVVSLSAFFIFVAVLTASDKLKLLWEVQKYLQEIAGHLERIVDRKNNEIEKENIRLREALLAIGRGETKPEDIARRATNRKNF